MKKSLKKVQKGISDIKKLYNILPRNTFLAIYKPFVRPHLDYGDIVYDHPNNQIFSNKIEAVQYNAALQSQTQSKEHLERNSIKN